MVKLEEYGSVKYFGQDLEGRTCGGITFVNDTVLPEAWKENFRMWKDNFYMLCEQLRMLVYTKTKNCHATHLLKLNGKIIIHAACAVPCVHVNTVV